MSDSEDDNLRPPRKKSKWINSESESDFVKEEENSANWKNIFILILYQFHGDVLDAYIC